MLFQSSDFGVGEISPVVVIILRAVASSLVATLFIRFAEKHQSRWCLVVGDWPGGFWCEDRHVRSKSGNKRGKRDFTPKDTLRCRKHLLSSLFKSLSNIVFIVLGVEASLPLKHRGYYSRSLLPCNTLQSPHTET